MERPFSFLHKASKMVRTYLGKMSMPFCELPDATQVTY